MGKILGASLGGCSQVPAHLPLTQNNNKNKMEENAYVGKHTMSVP